MFSVDTRDSDLAEHLKVLTMGYGALCNSFHFILMLFFHIAHVKGTAHEYHFLSSSLLAFCVTVFCENVHLLWDANTFIMCPDCMLIFIVWFFCRVICFSYFVLLLAEGGKYISHLLQAFLLLSCRCYSMEC